MKVPSSPSSVTQSIYVATLFSSPEHFSGRGVRQSRGSAHWSKPFPGHVAETGEKPPTSHGRLLADTSGCVPTAVGAPEEERV